MFSLKLTLLRIRIAPVSCHVLYQLLCTCDHFPPPQLATPSAVTELGNPSAVTELGNPSAVTELGNPSAVTDLGTPSAVTELAKGDICQRIKTPDDGNEIEVDLTWIWH